MEKAFTEFKGKYIAHDKISTADFAVAAIIFTYIYNESFAGGSDWLKESHSIVEKSTRVNVYVQ